MSLIEVTQSSPRPKPMGGRQAARPPSTVEAGTAVPTSGHVELNDEDFGRALKMGVLVGIPVLYAVVVAVAALAVPGNVALIAAAVWPAIVGGPFFGCFVSVLLAERRCQTEAGRAPARRSAPATRRRTPAPRARLAH
jgi:hypothetical protein